ncbi:chemotaxis protein CheW [Brevibacillus thermoruber]|uniref:Chemotaxis protein CheW n=1 Tax=Brevibacillus thermoruber TaxID=33942 RepID=A0A9X3TVF7_9BACL|nr:chemotaxis protein CheW [Brevibacillus thermoruber]MDA5111025.1 chemotaxis protein CheW [Brevibacillus thermoruber]
MLAEVFKAVIFRVGDEEYGLHIDHVLSIERMQPVTTVPKMPEYVKGVIHLRGIVTPIIELRKALLQSDVEENDDTRIIAVKVDGQPIGLVVDEATDVIDIPLDSIQKLNYGHYDVSFLLGVAKLNDRLLVLIDINNLLRNITSIDEWKNAMS